MTTETRTADKTDGIPAVIEPTVVLESVDGEASRRELIEAEPELTPGPRLVRMLVHRGTAEEGGALAEYHVPVEEGMVVLDALQWIQANVAPDLAVRWNCKAAKCGSCSAEVNGRPSLTCKTRLSAYAPEETITVEPMQTFPLIKDLVTDVSWNYEVNKQIVPFSPPPDAPDGAWRWRQADVDRGQEFRKCIECFLCQDVCHVLRNHEIQSPFMGPRFLVRVAALEMHPLDRADRLEHLHGEGGIGYCNITKCCTDVCPEHIKITDNAIIPLKERVADEYFDPIQMAWRKLTGRERKPTAAKRRGASARTEQANADQATTDQATTDQSTQPGTAEPDAGR